MGSCHNGRERGMGEKGGFETRPYRWLVGGLFLGCGAGDVVQDGGDEGGVAVFEGGFQVGGHVIGGLEVVGWVPGEGWGVWHIDLLSISLRLYQTRTLQR